MSTATTATLSQPSFARALDRAVEQGITVEAAGTILATGAAFYIVTGSQPGSFYSVAEVRDGAGLACTCLAGQNGRACKHVAAVLHHIEMERAARALEAASRARLAALEAVRAERVRRPRPAERTFSIFK